MAPAASAILREASPLVLLESRPRDRAADSRSADLAVELILAIDDLPRLCVSPARRWRLGS
jgi:hypothetical protein